MNSKIASLGYYFIILLFCSCRILAQTEKVKIEPPFLNDVGNKWVDSVYNSLSDDERIAQLFMVAAYSNKDSNHVNDIINLVDKYKIGGLIFMQGGPVRQAILTNKYQSVSKVPLMIAIDGEWGLAMRLDSTPKFPRQMMLGAIQDDEVVYRMGAEIAGECRQMGIQINFAPVIDVNNNPNNPVINTRSFGENKYNVASKGYSYMAGMQDNRILATGKHFPGHGDTDTDSHKSLPIIKHSYQRLDSLELYPFKELIEKGIGGIMVAHLYIPALDSTPNLATTLSGKVVNGLLKDSLNYKGLVFTDALNMKGVSSFFKPGEVDVKALLAGNDVLLFSENVPKAIDEIKKAILAGEITQDEINERCRKIIAFKHWSGLDELKPIDVKSLYYSLNSPTSSLVNRLLVENSLTLLKNDSDVLPVKNLEKVKIASVAMNEIYENTFQQTMDLYANVTHFQLPKQASTIRFSTLADSLKNYDLVIIGVHNPSQSASKNFGITKEAIDFISKVAEMNNVVLDIFANPYSLSKFKNIEKIKAVVMSYEDTELSQDYSAQMIFGGIAASGKLPVSASVFKEGTGIKTEKIRLKYSIPEEVNIDRIALNEIDSITLNGIQEKAFPGCQIVFAKDGVVFYRKSFGSKTYDTKESVKNMDIYDLASITKMAASTISLMKLYDEGKFNLDATMGSYLSYLDSTDKADLLIRDVMTHQARLTPWIPFWQKTVVKKELRKDLYSTAYSDIYSTKVADNLFIRSDYKDSILNRVINSKLLEKKEYKYSDLGYIMFRDVVEKQSGVALNKFADSVFYMPLGAYSMGYKPLDRFSKNMIVPTQNDLAFRKQLVHGYVHDPAAAMMGGVAGHAGLFANANDMAKLMQMLLNKGEYGGTRFLKKETVELFTSCQYCKSDNRRGLGFDKPELNTTKPTPVSRLASAKSYGHTGFTGTIAWVDPEYNLVYVFLSNRINPDEENRKLIKMDIREKIQGVVYKTIKAKQKEL